MSLNLDGKQVSESFDLEAEGEVVRKERVHVPYH